MNKANTLVEGPTIEQRIRAKKMLLTFGLFTIVMMFAALISAYIVMRYASPFWVNISMPPEFWTSTLIILSSSASIHFAVKFLRQGRKEISLALTGVTLVLGLLFCFQQYNGFLKLSSLGMPLTGNSLLYLDGDYGKDYFITNNKGEVISYINGDYYSPGQELAITEEVQGNNNTAASYFNFLVILHAAHVGLGILVLLICVVLLLTGILNKGNSLFLSQTGRYWHFVDALWIFLLLFLYIIH